MASLFHIESWIKKEYPNMKPILSKDTFEIGEQYICQHYGLVTVLGISDNRHYRNDVCVRHDIVNVFVNFEYEGEDPKSGIKTMYQNACVLFNDRGYPVWFTKS